MSEHSRLSPSRASQWVNCHGSVRMQEQYGETGDSPAAREGTAAHWVGEQLIVGRVVSIGDVAPNGVAVDSEMLEAATLYAEGLLSRYSSDNIILEQRVHAPQIHEEAWGTLDASVYDPGKNLLIIRDLKYGRGIVEPFENWQLMCYAAGRIHELNLPDQRLKVRLEICQPRGFHPKGPERFWEVAAIDLRPYFNTLHHAAHEALSDNPTVKTGTHCIYCDARHACPALRRSSAAILDYALQAVPEELTPEMVSREIEVLRYAAELIKYKLAAAEAQATGLIKTGEYVPGFVIEPGAGRVIWSRPYQEVIKLGEVMGINLSKEEAITPKQAISKGIPEEWVKLYSKVSESALKLTPVNKSLAYEAFGGKKYVP